MTFADDIDVHAVMMWKLDALLKNLGKTCTRLQKGDRCLDDRTDKRSLCQKRSKGNRTKLENGNMF